MPEGGELQEVTDQPDQHLQLDNNNDNEQNNNNDQPLLLELDESNAPGAEEPPDDGSALDGPGRFTREVN